MVSSSGLTGRRILITRTPGRASEFQARLETAGAIVLAIPTIEIVPPVSYAALDHALAHLQDFDWILFTSAHAVEVFHQRRDLAIVPPKIAAIGPATARAVEQAGLSVSLLPPRYVAESLAESLLTHSTLGSKFLLIRAAEARDVLPEALIHAGAQVTIAEAYRNRIPEDSAPRLQELFASPSAWPDAITFTSASTARNLAALLDSAGLVLPPGIVLASIGPITSQALRDLGLEPTLEASEATIPALTRSLEQYFHCPDATPESVKSKSL